MRFESKYDIGQKLWETRIKHTYTGEKCEHCGQTVLKGRWELEDVEQEIHDVNITAGCVTYKVWKPYFYKEYLPEGDIGRTFFTTREEALAEAERLNEEGQG